MSTEWLIDDALYVIFMNARNVEYTNRGRNYITLE